jgi:hypothetical protein
VAGLVLDFRIISVLLLPQQSVTGAAVVSEGRSFSFEPSAISFRPTTIAPNCKPPPNDRNGQLEKVLVMTETFWFPLAD